MIEIDHDVDIVARRAMARIAVSRTMAIPRQRVWDAVADLASHPVWMRDARSLDFVGEQRRGAGTRMRVTTRVGPLRTVDVMEVVGWDEGTSIDVAHQGLVRGRGSLSVRGNDAGVAVTWVEDLTFPWWLGAGLTAWLVRPFFAAIWRGNLERLERWLSSP